MPRVEATVVVPLDQDRAFALSQTYGELRYRWDPFVREQRLLDGAPAAAKGVRTWTRSRHRLRMVSQYVAFRPPEHVGMRMLDGPWFFGSFSGGWNFARAEEGGTRATWRYNFTIRPRWLAPVGDPLGERLLAREMRRRIDAFAAACADPAIVAAISGDEAPETPDTPEAAESPEGSSGRSPVGRSQEARRRAAGASRAKAARKAREEPAGEADAGAASGPTLAERLRAAARRLPGRRGAAGGGDGVHEAVAVRLAGAPGAQATPGAGGRPRARRERGAGTA